MNDIEVTGYSVRADMNGVIELECYMSDKSIWLCKPDGTDWRRQTPPVEELTKAFHKENVHNATIPESE